VLLAPGKYQCRRADGADGPLKNNANSWFGLSVTSMQPGAWVIQKAGWAR